MEQKKSLEHTQTDTSQEQSPAVFEDLKIGSKKLKPIYYTEEELALIRKIREESLRELGQIK